MPPVRRAASAQQRHPRSLHVASLPSQDLEPLARDTERFVFINVPYNFMFTCKARARASRGAAGPIALRRRRRLTRLLLAPQIAAPARLCAVFERVDAAAAP